MKSVLIAKKSLIAAAICALFSSACSSPSSPSVTPPTPTPQPIPIKTLKFGDLTATSTGDGGVFSIAQANGTIEMTVAWTPAEADIRLFLGHDVNLSSTCGRSRCTGNIAPLSDVRSFAADGTPQRVLTFANPTPADYFFLLWNFGTVTAPAVTVGIRLLP